MMRDGAKLASYRALAAALAQLPDVRWSLRIVGDGPARRDVEHAFGPVRGRVSFVGERAGPAIAALLRDSDVLVWPAIGEAIGLVFVEAQACGLPVIGGDSPGVAAVVDAGRTGVLVPMEDPPAFAAAIRRLANDPSLRQRMGAAAAAHVRRATTCPWPPPRSTRSCATSCRHATRWKRRARHERRLPASRQRPPGTR